MESSVIKYCFSIKTCLTMIYIISFSIRESYDLNVNRPLIREFNVKVWTFLGWWATYISTKNSIISRAAMSLDFSSDLYKNKKTKEAVLSNELLVHLINKLSPPPPHPPPHPLLLSLPQYLINWFFLAKHW